MRIFLTSLHIFVSAILIGMVLLQKGKGADIGAAFGGASQTVFGPRGAASFMAKLTTAAAVLFMITSLGLAITSSRRSSVMEGVRQEQTQPASGVPLMPPAQQVPVPAPAK
ncbi:MAG TPA: preprotein translocase subunit SecG [Nitrospirota bacterium]|nr:preprotein translocase subunit SecG [Nitrospirota bacterium]